MTAKSVALLFAFAWATAAWAAEGAASGTDDQLAPQISRLVQQLNDDRAAERDAAESGLLELAGATAAETDRFLKLLPEDSDQMPLAVRERLARIRQQAEDRVAKAAVESTHITLSAKGMPLADVFTAIEKQTGNRLIDNREQQGDEPGAGQPKITIELKDEPFWPAIDQILDQATLGVYSFGGEDALSIVGRASDEASRHGRASYGGPFRIDVLELQGQLNLRQPARKSLKVQLEVAWEPRLRPISLSQPAADVEATTDTGQKLAVSQAEAELDVEVPGGTQATEMILPFDLPDRGAKKITSIKGKMRALVPGRQVKFRFDNLANSGGKSERRGGVQVTLDDVRKNNAIWEVHMRLALDEDNDALQSHRDWVFQNVSYLVGKDNEPIENAGFETTRQTRNEVGIAYLFDVPDGIEGLSWVYETPAAIVELPVEYEIKDIDLP
jgi:hypothetical protein